MDMNETEALRRDICGSVLCIEDDPTSQALVTALLSVFPSVTLRVAVDGQSGIRAALDTMPDVILLDMHLPDMGGLKVVRELNQHIVDGECGVILLTADSLNIDIVKAMSLGAREYWLKPLSLTRLYSDLPRVLNALRAERKDAEQSAMRPGSRWISAANVNH